jgi:hypothetical protein
VGEELWRGEVAGRVQAEYLLRTQREMERAEADSVRLRERRALLPTSLGPM